MYLNLADREILKPPKYSRVGGWLGTRKAGFHPRKCAKPGSPSPLPSTFRRVSNFRNLVWGQLLNWPNLLMFRPFFGPFWFRKPSPKGGPPDQISGGSKFHDLVLIEFLKWPNLSRVFSLSFGHFNFEPPQKGGAFFPSRPNLKNPSFKKWHIFKNSPKPKDI